MAQGDVIGATSSISGIAAQTPEMALISALTPTQVYEIQQYAKILQFRDQITKGLHPRIKTGSSHSGPASTIAKSASSTNSPSSIVAPKKGQVNGSRPIDRSQGSQARPNRRMAKPPGLGTFAIAPNSVISKANTPGTSRIDPVLSEKSADLIRAETQAQRRRIETELQQQLEQHAREKRARLQASEQLPAFNQSEVLSKALSLVQVSIVKAADDTAANRSDSFDDNTFYSSSLQGTPDSRKQPRVAEQAADNDQLREESPYEPTLDLEPVVQPFHVRPTVPGLTTLLAPSGGFNVTTASGNKASNALAGSRNQQAPDSASVDTTNPQSSNLPASGESTDVEMATSSGSVEAIGTAVVDNLDKGTSSSVGTVMNKLPSGGIPGILDRRASPFIRGHDLSPIAPQPAHVFPSATARHDTLTGAAVCAAQGATTYQATSAQVTVPRKQTNASCTPNSSLRENTNKRNEFQAREAKRELRKQKKKAGRLAAAATPLTASPGVKPEPRSPSPIQAPHVARLNKRQKRVQRPRQGSFGSYGAKQDQQPIVIDDNHHDFLQSKGREERLAGYELMSRRPSEKAVMLAPPRFERLYSDRAESPSSARTIFTEAAYASPYSTVVPRSLQSGSFATVPSSFGESPAYYRETGAVSRMSVRHGASRDRSRSPVIDRNYSGMPPPRAPARRIIIDEFGRQYYEPSRAVTVVREPVPYEDLRPDMFEENGVLYKRVSSYAPQSRATAQPEMGVDDYRQYRERDYPPTPMGPPRHEYTPAGIRAESRPIIERSYEHLGRAASVRPVEATRYESASGYDTRIAEPPLREYLTGRALSVRPGEPMRCEMPVGYEMRRREVEIPREYVSHRATSVRPVDQVRYEVTRDYEPLSATFRAGGPYASGAIQQDRREEPLPRDRRARSVVPIEAPHQQFRREYSDHPVQRYYP